MASVNALLKRLTEIFRALTAQVSLWSIIIIIVFTCDEINKISNIVICNKKMKVGGQL